MPRRRWAIAVQATGIVVAVLDNSIANVALPTISQGLDVAPADAVWIVNAYNLTVLVTLLPLAALGERVGLKRVFAAGLLLFSIASLACALSTSITMLAAARVLQGLGAAALMSMMGGLVRHIYPNRLLGRGIGLNAMIVGTAGAMGPTVSSAILSVADWPWLFAINVPIGVAAFFAARCLPDSQRHSGRFDAVSALLSAAVLTLIVVGVGRIAAEPGLALALIGGGLAAGYVMVRRARRQSTPLVPVDLFRIPPFSYAVAASMLLFASQMAAFVALPFYFLSVFGREQVAVGFLMTAWPIGAGIMAPVAGRLADRHSAAMLSGVGACLTALGLLWLLLLPAGTRDLWIVFALFVAGVGFGFFQSPNNRAMLSSVPMARSGAAGGVQATTRTFGQSLGAAIVGVAFAASARHGPSAAVAFAIASAVAAALVNVVRVRRRM